MSFDVFFNFDGECKEAVEFYAKAFNSQIVDMMSYGDMPPNPDFIVPESHKTRIMYACVPIFGCNVMFSDMPDGMPLIKGNNISPTISSKDKDELTRVFHALAAGGEIGEELGKTFWSDMYGMVTDKFGIIWQISHDSDSGKTY